MKQNSLLHKLTLANWDNVFNELNVDKTCENSFHSTISNCITESILSYNKHFSCSNKRRLKPWISAGLLVSIRLQRDKLSLKAKKPPDSKLVKYFKNYKNRLCSLIRSAKTCIIKMYQILKKPWETIDDIFDRTKKKKSK